MGIQQDKTGFLLGLYYQYLEYKALQKIVYEETGAKVEKEILLEQLTIAHINNNDIENKVFQTWVLKILESFKHKDNEQNCSQWLNIMTPTF